MIFCAKWRAKRREKISKKSSSTYISSGALVAISGVKLGLFADEYGSIFDEMARQFSALYVAQVLKGVLTDSGLRSDRSIHPNAIE